MKYFLIAILVTVSFSCSENSGSPEAKKSAQINIDALVACPENYRLLLENPSVKIIEYTLEPGAKDHWHTLPPRSSYAASGGKLRVHMESGETILSDAIEGSVAWMNYLGKHYTENIGDTKVKLILTEVKSASK